MERLTERDEYGNANIIGVDSADLQLNLEFDAMNKVTETLNKLAAYEDRDEQGKMLKLPCAVGDTVYVLRIDNAEYMMSNKRIWEIAEERFEVRHFKCIGKTVFLTKPEAERALKGMEGRNE